MAISITHTFVSAKGDPADTTLVRPSNWNANHTFTMATARVLGRKTAGAGAIEELDFTDSATRTAIGLGTLATLSTVATAYLDADAVTYAKIQNVTATSRLLGRYSSGAGDIEEITFGTGIEMTAAGAIASTSLFPRGYLQGNTLSHAADTDHDITIAAGSCRDSTNAEDMVCTALTKRIDAAWAVGTNQGGMDTGSVAANTWYHIWRIKRVDTDVVDALFSTSTTAPTMPTNYTVKRRIGSVLTDASANIIAFVQHGRDFYWDVPVRDVNRTTDHSTAVNATLSVPTGFKMKADISVFATGQGDHGVLVSPMSITDTAPADPSTAAPGVTAWSGDTGSDKGGTRFSIWTDTSARVRYRATISTIDTVIITHGWYDPAGVDD